MQLNPARGRKPIPGIEDKLRLVDRFMQLNPARGRKPIAPGEGVGVHAVYAAQPREGTETLTKLFSSLLHKLLGLCSSNPRGDGNYWH